nr:unnamed protein product [Digitaria exilis]
MPAAEADYPAIRRLGRLFRITEDFHADKPHNKASKDIDEGHSFVEDLELANLMGSLGLPVSFSTSKVNKNKGNKGMTKRRHAPREAGNTQIDDVVRICTNTEDRESDVPLMAVLEHMNSCKSSGTAIGYHDTDKMLKEGSPYVEEQEESGCSTIYSAEKAPAYEAENQCDLGTCERSDNLGNTAKAESPIQENQTADSVLLESEEMSRHDSVHDHSYQDIAGNISNDIIKYWTQRYSLFSLFDSGIKMDAEGWFSVTPEPIAKHHASRVGAGVMIDCFTGVGGNAIQFAAKCKHVIAVDIDPQKINCAHHNATIYGVNDHIDFIVGDFTNLAPHLKGETAFMSPPWGGPDYAKVDVYDMNDMLKPCDGYSLFKLGTMIASKVEKNFLNGKLKAITAYFEEQDG